MSEVQQLADAYAEAAGAERKDVGTDPMLGMLLQSLLAEQNLVIGFAGRPPQEQDSTKLEVLYAARPLQQLFKQTREIAIPEGHTRYFYDGSPTTVSRLMETVKMSAYKKARFDEVGLIPSVNGKNFEYSTQTVTAKILKETPEGVHFEARYEDTTLDAMNRAGEKAQQEMRILHDTEIQAKDPDDDNLYRQLSTVLKNFPSTEGVTVFRQGEHGYTNMLAQDSFTLGFDSDVAKHIYDFASPIEIDESWPEFTNWLQEKGWTSATAIPILTEKNGKEFILVGHKDKIIPSGAELTNLQKISTILKFNIENIKHMRAEKSIGVTDELTGLLNLRGFRMEFIKMLSEAKRNGTPLTMIMPDIDHFKLFNEDFSHAVGDQTLKRTANVMKGSARTSDVTTRIGGEEFGILIPGFTEDGITVAERLRKNISQEKITAKNQHTGNVEIRNLTLSNSVVSATDLDFTTEDLIQAQSKGVFKTIKVGDQKNEKESYTKADLDKALDLRGLSPEDFKAVYALQVVRSLASAVNAAAKLDGRNRTLYATQIADSEDGSKQWALRRAEPNLELGELGMISTSLFEPAEGAIETNHLVKFLELNTLNITPIEIRYYEGVEGDLLRLMTGIDKNPHS